MLYRDRDSQEGYIHICDDAHKYQRKYIAERPQILVHDVRSYMRINGSLIDVKFCPYCGAELQKEIENASGKFYEF